MKKRIFYSSNCKLIHCIRTGIAFHRLMAMFEFVERSSYCRIIGRKCTINSRETVMNNCCCTAFCKQKLYIHDSSFEITLANLLIKAGCCKTFWMPLIHACQQVFYMNLGMVYICLFSLINNIFMYTVSQKNTTMTFFAITSMHINRF